MKVFFRVLPRLIAAYLLSIRYFFTFWWYTFLRFLTGANKDTFAQSPFTLGAWCFRRMLEDLGATYVKVGQIMSTRPDILPPWMIDELVKLQDSVPPFNSKLIPAEFEKAFGRQPEEIFAEFDDKPIASASVAQVHEARLKSGEKVAVKIRRPGVKEKAELDLEVMDLFARSICIIPSIRLTSPVEAVEEFAKSIKGQLDLKNEAENNHRFHENFRNNPKVIFPKLYEEYCAENILTMEFIEGYKLADIDKTNSDPKELARQGLRAIFQMIYIDGFVHADLHPGNLRFFDDNVVCYFDLGMVAELTDEDRERFVESFMAMAQNDGKMVAKLMADYAPYQNIQDWDAYEKDVAEYVNTYFGKPLNEIEISVAIAKVTNTMRKHHVRADATYTVFCVAMLVAEGLGRKLYPEIDLNAELFPYLQDIFQKIMARRAAEAKAQKSAEKPAETGAPAAASQSQA